MYKEKDFNKNAFTLAEVLMVMLVLSIIMAAFAPMMTTRNKVDLGSPWKYSVNNSDIYYGLGSSQTAIIGDKEVKSSDFASRLSINTSNDKQNHILFKTANKYSGSLITTEGGLVAIGPYAANKFYNDNALTITDTDTSPNSIAIGKYALGAAAPSSNAASDSIAVGSGALSKSSNYGQNIAIGHYSLMNNEYFGNTAVGYKAMLGITGTDNVAIGRWALSVTDRPGTMLDDGDGSSNNVAIGTSALRGANKAQGNTAVGYSALFSVKSNNDNVAVGCDAGLNIVGDNNTIVGSGALANAAFGSNNVAIGKDACANVSGESRSKICIGSGSGPAADEYEANTLMPGIYIADNVEKPYIRIGKYIGQQTKNFYYVNGSYNYIGGNQVILDTPFAQVLGNMYLTGTLAQNSDARLKNIKGENKDGLSKIKQINVLNYTFKDDKKKVKRVGVTAQELQKVFPDAVMKNEDGYLSIRKEDMFFAMINAIKELAALFDNITLRVLRLENENKALKKQNAALQKQIISINERLEKLEND